MYAYSRNTSCMFIHVELRLVGLIICMHTSCSVVHVTVDTNLRLISTCIYFRIPPSDPPPHHHRDHTLQAPHFNVFSQGRVNI